MRCVRVVVASELVSWRGRVHRTSLCVCSSGGCRQTFVPEAELHELRSAKRTDSERGGAFVASK